MKIVFFLVNNVQNIQRIYAMHFVENSATVKYLGFAGSFATIKTGFNDTQHTGNQAAAIQNNEHSLHIVHVKGLCIVSLILFLMD